MNPKCFLVTTPAVDLTAFSSVCQQVLGHSPLHAVARLTRELSLTEKYLRGLAALRDPNVTGSLAPNLLAHASVSVGVVATDEDVYDIVECCAGMTFVTAETTASHILLAIVSGTLAQWRSAVVSGCEGKKESSVRAGFNSIHSLLRGATLNLWPDYCTREAHDHTLLLEYKPQK